MNNREKDKYLILSATFGEGHKQVANAISEAVNDMVADAEPITMDIMEWIHPIFIQSAIIFTKKALRSFLKCTAFCIKKLV